MYRNNYSLVDNINRVVAQDSLYYTVFSSNWIFNTYHDCWTGSGQHSRFTECITDHYTNWCYFTRSTTPNCKGAYR